MSFLFDRDFDAEDAAALPAAAQHLPELPIRVSLTAEELAAELARARTEGRDEGHAAGLTEGRRAAEEEGSARATASLAALAPEIAALRGALSHHRKERERDLIGLTRALAERLLPEFGPRFGPRRLEAFCRRALSLAEGPGGLTLEVPPAALPRLQSEFATTQTAGGAALRLLPAEDLAPGAARARWTAGHADFHPEALLTEILATLDLLSREAAQATTEGSDDHGQP
ncbi:FliH/SctL family protein [Falsigemmobacter faecalis]|uniref:Flagellar assembly protein FliH/Type III secretion system HrpE domain-containing protein n=1 Tax=Falsigemmobacter faecalis TaxID=2488730 RepID=A0A3P3D7V5_9RHOB|nr:hypothetical protein [Falsigemmobacter faecalis]RRH69874.1 hypothetical protein EG244_17890 [Falsigemmobacter faecalis]